MVQGNVNFESLSEVLKNSTRRRIILYLYDKEGISYVDLMKSVGVTNTGKFNYHLKILGDLIEKDENGKYSLSEKGQLAVQFLQQFDNSKGEAPVLETRAFNLFAGFMWLGLLYPFMGLLFGWYLYFADATTAFNGDLAQQLVVASLIGIPAFTLLTINQFPKIEIDRDSIIVKWATGRKFFAMEEAKIDTRGRVLRIGRDYFAPFKEKQCRDLLSKRIETYRSKPFYIAYMVPPLFFGVLFALLKRPEGLFAPELWAILWGVTIAVSATMFFYSFPAEIRLGNMNRGFSALVYGLFVGITIAVSIFLSLI